MQKVWSLIPFFTDHWKCDIPPVGSDLGMGLFQFQFELESDLQTVLEKRPYHYTRWMVILQQWEPTISPDFPSMIPFWIKILGVPIHLWSEEVARSIDDDICTFEVADITPQAIRMRVHVNGRLPLIKTTIVEFSSAGEVFATLQYEKLERHCLKCGRLDHEIRDCLEAKHEKKAQLVAQQEVSIRSRASVTNNELPLSKDKLHSGGPARLSPRSNHRYEPYSRNDHSYRTEYDRTKEPLRRSILPRIDTLRSVIQGRTFIKREVGETSLVGMMDTTATDDPLLAEIDRLSVGSPTR